MQDPDFPPNETSVGEVAAIKSGFNGTLKWCGCTGIWLAGEEWHLRQTLITAGACCCAG